MGENELRDELPDVAPLIMRAKHGKDEETCRAAGAAVIESLRTHGRYSAMIDLSLDPKTPPFLVEGARKSILGAAFIACKKSGTLLPMQDVATRQDVPLEVALHAGVSLVIRHAKSADWPALWAILKDARFHDEVRTEAGNALLSHAEAKLEFSTLLRLATEEGVTYEVKKPAGHLLIKLAVEVGNYPIIMALEKVRHIPVDIRIALENKVEEAARTAIGLAHAEGDSIILTDISKDSRLAASIRGRAMGCLNELSRAGPQVSEGVPDKEMTAELMYRLGTRAGAVRSSKTPSPSSERPTYKEPLSRPKR